MVRSMRWTAAFLLLLGACAADSQRAAPVPGRDSTTSALPRDAAMSTPIDAAPPSDAPATTAPLVTDAEWARAERVLRDHLAAKAIAFTEVSASRRRGLTTFSVALPDGRAVYALVAGDDAWFDPPKDLTFVGEYLERVGWLASRTPPAIDVLFLAKAYGKVPAEIENVVGSPRGELRGYPTTVEDRKGGGVAIVQHYPRVRQGRPPGAVAGPRKLPAYRAVLTISPAYELAWKVEEVEVADLEPTR